jgi:hypothetical protein
VDELHAPGPCALCGTDPAKGFASVNDEWFCHGDFDPDPTCYMRAQRPKPEIAFSEAGDPNHWHVTFQQYEDLCPCGVSLKHHSGIYCEWQSAR